MSGGTRKAVRVVVEMIVVVLWWQRSEGEEMASGHVQAVGEYVRRVSGRIHGFQ